MTMDEVVHCWEIIPYEARRHLERKNVPDKLDVPPRPDGVRVKRR